MYLVGSPSASYLVPEFTLDTVSCTLQYALAYDTTQTWLTPLSDRALEWFTIDNSLAGAYTITVEVTTVEAPELGVVAAVSYKLTVVESCLHQQITPTPQTDYIYVVGDPYVILHLEPLFTTDMPNFCPLDLSVSITPTPQNWIFTTIQKGSNASTYLEWG